MDRSFCVCRWRLDPEEVELRRLKEAGIRMIETGFEQLREMSQGEAERLRQSFEDAGVVFRSIHAPFGAEDDLTSLEEEKRMEAGRRALRFMARVSWIGAEVVVIHPGHLCGPEEVESRESLLPLMLPSLLDEAQRCGIEVAVENLLPNHPFMLAERLAAVVDSMECEWLGICFDSGHAHVGGDVLAQFDACRERVIALHLHDNDRTRDLHLQPGYGTIPWEPLFAEIEALKPDVPLTVEAAPWGDHTLYPMMMKELQAVREGRHLHPLEGLERKGKILCGECGRLVLSEEGTLSCGCE